LVSSLRLEFYVGTMSRLNISDLTTPFLPLHSKGGFKALPWELPDEKKAREAFEDLSSKAIC